MTDSPNAWLTPKRRKYLSGQTEDFSDSALHAHKYRIRDRARRAFNELIEVYESDMIDNSEVFKPDDMRRLINALMSDFDGVPRNEFDDPLNHHEEYAYYHALLSELEHLCTLWELGLLGKPLESPKEEITVESLEKRTD